MKYIIAVIMWGDIVYIDTLPTLEMCEIRQAISQAYSRDPIVCKPVRRV